ncbi:MAG: hypothetical protein ACHQX3_04810, partial [Nitrospirales bacterium]
KIAKDYPRERAVKPSPKDGCWSRSREDGGDDLGEKSRQKDPLRLGKYDGNTSLPVFLQQFDNCSEYNGWDDKAKLAQLKGALVGNAAQVLVGEEVATGGYLGLREELNKSFGQEGHAGHYERQLWKRRRGLGESIRSLRNDIGRLVLLAFPGPATQLRDRLAVTAFTDGLNDKHLARRIKDQFPRTLADAFQWAMDLDANTPGSDTENHQVNRDGSRRMKTRQQRMEVAARQAEFDDEARWEQEKEFEQIRERLQEAEREARLAKEEVTRYQDEQRESIEGLRGQFALLQARGTERRDSNRFREIRRAFEDDSESASSQQEDSGCVTSQREEMLRWTDHRREF